MKQKNKEEYKPQVKQRCGTKAQNATELVLELLVLRTRRVVKKSEKFREAFVWVAIWKISMKIYPKKERSHVEQKLLRAGAQFQSLVKEPRFHNPCRTAGNF